MEVQAPTSVTALKTDRTTLACFHNTGIKQKFSQERDGKIYVVEDRETDFIIALKSLTLSTRICILEQPGVFSTHGSFKWNTLFSFSPWHVISFSFTKISKNTIIVHRIC